MAIWLLRGGVEVVVQKSVTRSSETVFYIVREFEKNQPKVWRLSKCI